MDPQKREALTSDLKAIVAEMAIDIRRQVLAPGAARLRAEALHRDERVATDFDVWTDLLSRRAAVLWVLKTVYIRVLEDRGLLRPIRIRDRESQTLFEHLTSLADTAYLRWIFRDLACPEGLPELFADQPAEVAAPSNALSARLLSFWRKTDETTGEFQNRFDEEHFDGRLMGDLYQDLDPVVKKRFALAQTPDFILDFILDETLTPAITEFGVENVRVLDPSCGSGHFLLAAMKRLVASMREKFPERPMTIVVPDVMRRVVGIDINDYACGLARARLVMTGLELIGDERIETGTGLHPQVYWADGLEQVEWDDRLVEPSGEVRASLTRPAVRAALRPVLRDRFHVVVGNPPYITEKDKAAKAYHREKISGRQRYVSASGKYGLGAPFTERMIQLCVDDGYMGEIVSNSFMKRNFGKALIKDVLGSNDLSMVVDLAGARIPNHGTPTALLFVRRRAPSQGDVLVVMGKKGDPPGKAGKVWESVVSSQRRPGFEDEYISVAMCARATLARHPWSIGGGGAAELKAHLESRAPCALAEFTAVAGFASFPGADGVFVLRPGAAERRGLPGDIVKPLVTGDSVRNWGISPTEEAIAPYGADHQLVPESRLALGQGHFWAMRSIVLATTGFGGETRSDAGADYWSWYRWIAGRYDVALTITFGEVATHNHFALARLPGVVFNQTAPIIQLKSEYIEEYFPVLAMLNSSAACFWMKQVCQNKGSTAGSDGSRVTAEPWDNFFQFGASRVRKLPLPLHRARAAPLAQCLDLLARERTGDSLRAVIATEAKEGASVLKSHLLERRSRDEGRLLRMVALQEELDWLVYGLYGLDPDAPENEVREPQEISGYRPGLRPFEITLAQEDAERRAAIAAGEDPDEAPTKWFERHGWAPATTLAELPEGESAIVAARMARTEASRELAMLEQPTHKRRWNRPDYDAEEREAFTSWLADRLGSWAQQRREPFTIEDAANSVQADPEVLAVGELLANRPDYSLVELVGDIVRQGSVPSQKFHVFSSDGLIRRAAWEATWAAQWAEDGGTSREVRESAIKVPPEYAKTDYLADRYWQHRGTFDIPQERFIALTEMPGPGSSQALFAWAGLTPRQRARMFVELDELAERSGVAREDRIGLLHAIWFLVPYVTRESEAASREYRAAVTAIVGEAGVTEEMLAEWAARHLPPTRAKKPAVKRSRRTKAPKETDEA